MPLAQVFPPTISPQTEPPAALLGRCSSVVIIIILSTLWNSPKSERPADHSYVSVQFHLLVDVR